MGFSFTTPCRPKALKDFEYISGFYEVTNRPGILDVASKELVKANTTKCHGLMLQTLTGEPDKSKARKACLKVLKLVEEKKLKLRKSVSARAALAIKMEL